MYWLKKVNRLGVSSKELRKAGKEIQRYNVMMLWNFTIVAAPLILVYLLLSFVFRLRISDSSVVAIFAFITLGFAVIAQQLLNSKKFTASSAYLLITAYDIVVYASTIYLGNFANKESVGTLFIIFLMASQVLYVMPVTWNFIMSTFPTLVFIVSSVLLKESDLYLQDIRNAVVALAIGLLLNSINSREKAQLIASKETLSREFVTLTESSELDPLTGLFNKAVSQRKIRDFCKACSEEKNSIFVAMVDVDFFKKYNDNYGHPKGDEVLVYISGLMKRLANEYGIVAGRVGGEEFILVGSVGSRLQATRISDKLRYEVEESRIEHLYSDVEPIVTISVGVAFADIGTYVESAEIYEKADAALYQAKKSGRNCVKTVTL